MISGLPHQTLIFHHGVSSRGEGGVSVSHFSHITHFILIRVLTKMCGNSGSFRRCSSSPAWAGRVRLLDARERFSTTVRFWVFVVPVRGRGCTCILRGKLCPIGAFGTFFVSAGLGSSLARGLAGLSCSLHIGRGVAAAM